MKIKIFGGDYSDDLEKKVNCFLETVNVLDVIPLPKGNSSLITIVVVYEEEKGYRENARQS